MSIEIKKDNSKIQYIKPCTTLENRGKFQANVSLGKKLDPKKMCEELSKVYKDVKCSEKGVAKFGWMGMAIMVFSNGTITIRGAVDKDDIIRTVEMIKKVVLEE